MSIAVLLLWSPLAIAAGMSTDSKSGTTVAGAPELKDVDIEEKLGTQIPLDTEFTTSEGVKTKLRDLMIPGKPAILTLNYYECPMLCTLVLNGLAQGIKGLGFNPGLDYQILTISISPKEEAAMAAEKKANYLASVGRPIDAKGWTFLLGDKTSIDAVTTAAGFHYKYEKDIEQYAHAAAIFVLTPEGTISRVLYGIEFPPRDLRLALVEAGQGKLGSAIDKLILYCFHYDPAGRRYAMYAMNVMRLGGGIFAIVLSVFVWLLFRNERRRRSLGLGKELKGEI